jgi:hypothetical protein
VTSSHLPGRLTSLSALLCTSSGSAGCTTGAHTSPLIRACLFATAVSSSSQGAAAAGGLEPVSEASLEGEEDGEDAQSVEQGRDRSKKAAAAGKHPAKRSMTSSGTAAAGRAAAGSSKPTTSKGSGAPARWK